MKKLLLLPPAVQRISWLIFIPSTLAGLYFMQTQQFLPFLEINNPFWDPEHTAFLQPERINLTLTVSAVLILLSAMGIAFSSEKKEDEYIQFLRLQSWARAVFISHLILLTGILFFYGLNFMEFITYNIFSTLFIFIAQFRYALFRFYRSDHEK